jgi:hypothetical protein
MDGESRLLDVHNFVAEKLRHQLQMLHDLGLSPSAKVLGCQLTHDLNVKKQGAWRSQAELSRLLGMDVKTVRRATAELVIRGHLVTTPSRGRGNAILYQALMKEGDFAPVTDPQTDRKAGKKPRL